VLRSLGTGPIRSAKRSSSASRSTCCAIGRRCADTESKNLARTPSRNRRRAHCGLIPERVVLGEMTLEECCGAQRVGERTRAMFYLYG